MMPAALLNAHANAYANALLTHMHLSNARTDGRTDGRSGWLNFTDKPLLPVRARGNENQ